MNLLMSVMFILTVQLMKLAEY